ncbi:MAG: glycosyltransferase family 2 protein [Aquabacterium sp.]
MPPPTLSVTLITKNEAGNIADCIRSVQWADEIIVVDSGSTDDTIDIARQLGAKVYQTSDWPGFGIQKNRALSHATSDWILTIDADERVTPALAKEIRQAVQRNASAAYASPRLTYFAGKPVRHCGWYPDHSARLFRRGRGRFSDHLVHEHLILDDPVLRLKGDLLHYSYRDMQQARIKEDAYGRAGAQELIRKGRRPMALTPHLKGGWAWFRTFILRGGILDGRTGMAISRMNARTTFLKYQLAHEHARQANRDSAKQP